MKKISFTLFIFLSFFLAVPVLAETLPASSADQQCVTEYGKLQFCPNVSIGGTFVRSGNPIDVNESTLGNYIATWYGFVIGTIGILAAIMIMYGGVKWLTSRGGQAVSDAKDIIFSALIGLTLAFLSYTILNLVNPNLLKLGLPKMGAIQYDKNFDLATINPEGETRANSGGNYGPPNTNFTGDFNKTLDSMATDAENNDVNVPTPTNGVRPNDNGSLHQTGRAADYPNNDPEFNNYMEGLIAKGEKAPYSYEDKYPVYYVTFPDGTPGRVIKESNCWHVDNGRKGESYNGRTL